MMMAKTDSRIVCCMRQDRARIESRVGTSTMERPGQPQEETRLVFVRSDLGVSWITEPWDTSYTEAPWPDTLTCPPSQLPTGLADSVAYVDPIESLDWTNVITRTGVRDTIAGYPAEHVVVRASGRPGDEAAKVHERQIASIRRMDPSLDEASYPKSPSGMDFVYDLWLAQGVPAEFDSLWSRFLSRAIRNDEAACLTGLPTKLDSTSARIERLGGTLLRCRVALTIEGMAGVAEALRMARARQPDSLSAEDRYAEGLLDMQSGALLLWSYEVVSIREEAVPDARYELPAGLRKKPRSTPWDLYEPPIRRPPR